jgi:hypothetical protein
MSSILRISGRTLDIDKCVERSRLTPIFIYRRGEAINSSKPKGKKNSRSGASFQISRRTFFMFDAQVRETQTFLGRHETEIRRLRRFKGVDSACVDFGVDPEEGVAVQSWRFPENLISLANRLRLELELSVYLFAAEPTKPSRRKTRSPQLVRTANREPNH